MGDGLGTSIRLLRSVTPVALAGELVADAVGAADAARGHARLVVPGGSALSALGRARACLDTAVWLRVRLTWTDERCVPRCDPDSTRGTALREGILDAGAPPAVDVALYADGEEPRVSVERVCAELARHFDDAFDVVLLGMGPDGHVASLFPGRPWDEDGRMALYVEDSPKPPPSRITLSRVALGTARQTILLAHGEAKRAALARLVAGDPALPATGLAGLTIVTDQTF